MSRHLAQPEDTYTDAFRFGFVMNYAGTQETTIAFDGSNVFTLAPTGTFWHYYRNDVRYTISGSKTVKLKDPSGPADKGFYYIYIDATDGTLTASTSGWTLEDTKVPVATVTWDNALTPKYWMSDERHTSAIDRRYHWEHHFSDGTEVVKAPVLTGPNVSPSSPADTNNTFAVAETILSDEDLKHTLAALANPDATTAKYAVFFRNGAGVWNWETSKMPYRYTAAGYIQYDLTGTMTQGQGNKFYNTYLLATNHNDAGRYAIVHGQAEFSTLVAAQAETFGSLAKTGINIAEFVACYQFNWETSAAYSTTGKARLAATPRPILVSASGAGSVSAAISHDSTLTGDGSAGSPLGLIGGTSGRFICNGRLTLETGVAVSTTDQSDKTTLYFTPYKGSQISLYDGVSVWNRITFSELSLNISAYTASKPYDIWVYNNAGVATLDSTVWTNATTRATALALQDGVYIKNGDATRRYIGTIYMDAASKCQDKPSKRFVWNYYNRVTRNIKTYNTTASWAYSTATWREYNNGTGQVRGEFIIGVNEESYMTTLYGAVYPTTNIYFDVALAYDSTTGTNILNYIEIYGTAAIPQSNALVGYGAMFSAGYHYSTLVERIFSTGTANNYGDVVTPGIAPVNPGGALLGSF